ncbi:MAG TPA: TonB family protein [Rectinemataceae bacterium]|nr:TonB family protein [Rectinemataceae bacterium]
MDDLAKRKRFSFSITRAPREENSGDIRASLERKALRRYRYIAVTATTILYAGIAFIPGNMFLCDRHNVTQVVRLDLVSVDSVDALAEAHIAQPLPTPVAVPQAFPNNTEDSNILESTEETPEEHVPEQSSGPSLESAKETAMSAEKPSNEPNDEYQPDAESTQSDEAAAYAPPSADEVLAFLSKGIEKRKNYPEAARLKSAEGTVRINVLILPDGSLKSLRILARSGSAILDRAAMDLVKSLFPMGIALAGEMEVLVPIEYRLIR